MPSSPTLGPRLKALLALVKDVQQSKTYDQLWDCCCDHGYLGIQILRRQLLPRVTFVDKVPSIIELLQPRLTSFAENSYDTLTSDVGDLTPDPTKRHLLIIAGVGGENTVDMLKALQCTNPHNRFDFLFCPTTTQYQLREYLAENRYSLRHEELVTEKGRDYEVIYVQHPSNCENHSDVSLTGRMWQENRPEHLRYLNKLVGHYSNKSRTDTSGSQQKILERYQQCLTEISAL